MDGQWQGYQLPEDLRMLKSTVREFVQSEIVPLERELDPEAISLPEEEYRRLAAKTKAMGLWNLGLPVEYGGGGFNTFGMTVLQEEMVQHRNGLYGAGYGAFGRAPQPLILQYGTDDQKERFVWPVLREERTSGFMAITEPSGGSDPAGAIRTHAVRDGDDWVLNGSKVFISGALEEDHGIVFARTDPQSKRGITCFIIEKGMAGFTWQPIPVIRPYYPAQLFFDNVRIPARNVLGEVNRAWDMLANKLLARARIPYSAANLGVAVAAQRLAVAYAKERSTFGAPLASRQAIQWMLVDSDIEIRACRWLVWEAAWKYDEGDPNFRLEASIAKVYSSEVLGHVVDRAVQVHGGYGVSKWLPLERWYREARVRRIGEGPSEVQRMLIARYVLA